MNTMCEVLLTNHLLRVVSDVFRPTGHISATEQLRSKLHKTEDFPIASTLLVVKAKNIYRNTIERHKTMETELSH